MGYSIPGFVMVDRATTAVVKHRRQARPGVLAAEGVLGLIVLLAILPNAFAPHSALDQDLATRLRPPAWLAGGSWDHVLGTDALGRDVLSRIIFGARVSLAVGVMAVVVSGVLGVGLGVIAGYFRGHVDDLIMRVTEVQLSFPFILAAVAIVSVLGAGLRNIILVLGLTGWTTYARVVRGAALALREQEFLEAARAVGCSHFRVMRRYILPNIMGTVLVLGTFALATFVIAESALSYLGLGVQPPTPTWGGMLADGYLYLRTAWWITTFPGLVLMLTVLSINVIGDWARDVFDPRLRNIL
ncbi:MAG TPA: ABC transporter permease [bacterium]|nr:ABC transporter permease [bacterium]